MRRIVQVYEGVAWRYVFDSVGRNESLLINERRLD
jgi:hypothetical protein